MRSHLPNRRVPSRVRFGDRLVGVLLSLGGAGVLSILALSLLWLAWRALRAGDGPADFVRIGSWMAGSVSIALAGALLSFPLALAGAVWTDPGKSAWVVRLCAALPLSIPAFLVAMLLAKLANGAFGWPVEHRLWAIVALGWGGIAPQWIRFSRALALPGLGHWREGALALGIPDHRILSSIAFPAARRGIFAGWLRSLARGSGETMVILLVAGHTSGEAWTAGAAVVRELPHAVAGGGLWLDLLRVAFLLGAWTVLLHLIAARLDQSQSRVSRA
ncbi:MAG: ABC transporter permease [Fibrobacterota bacterium]|nr:ABC transporter permease [Fibrobacterota bacterium]QQS05004.1 MAG: ABC transporter permease [Fibrobacterota bacterium]